MNIKEFLLSRNFKLLLPLLIVGLAIAIWKRGYEFGQWLHAVLN